MRRKSNVSITRLTPRFLSAQFGTARRKVDDIRLKRENFKKNNDTIDLGEGFAALMIAAYVAGFRDLMTPRIRSVSDVERAPFFARAFVDPKGPVTRFYSAL